MFIHDFDLCSFGWGLSFMYSALTDHFGIMDDCWHAVSSPVFGKRIEFTVFIVLLLRFPHSSDTLFEELAGIKWPFAGIDILLKQQLIVSIRSIIHSGHLSIAFKQSNLRWIITFCVAFETLRILNMLFFVRTLLLHDFDSFTVVELAGEIWIKWLD